MGGIERLVKSLETKWGPITHNISKFISMYGYVAMFNMSGNSSDDTFHESFEYIRSKIQKVRVFFHSLLVSSKGCAKVGDLKKMNL
jgi:hypothetical protein